MSESTEQEHDLKKEPILIPGMGLVDDATAVTLKLIAAIPEAERISIVNPIAGAIQHYRIRKKHPALRAEVNKILSMSVTALSRPVQNANVNMGAMLQTWSQGQNLAAFTLADAHWRSFDGTLDKKAAFLVASFSVYLSTLCLLVTLIPFFLHSGH